VIASLQDELSEIEVFGCSGLGVSKGMLYSPYKIIILLSSKETV
jgi:hypothetical protein